MTVPLPPAGYDRVLLPLGGAWVLPRAKKPLLAGWKKLNDRVPLRQAARRHPEATLFRGRAPVVSFPCLGLGSVVVRPCWHGGYWGRLTRDLYLGSSRAMRELLRSRALLSKKIPTPEILAVLFYPAGCFLRIDVVTASVTDSRDLVSFLSSRPSFVEKKSGLAAIRFLFSKLHQHGIVHGDLNARNILLSDNSKKAWLLDVDAVDFGKPRDPETDTANRNRLLRSLLKRARLGELGMEESSVPALWRELFPAR